jgi:hypothetical protein
MKLGWRILRRGRFAAGKETQVRRIVDPITILDVINKYLNLYWLLGCPVVVMLLTCVKEAFLSNFNRNTSCPDWRGCWCIQSMQKNTGSLPRVCQVCKFPSPLHFTAHITAHHSLSHLTLCNLDTGTVGTLWRSSVSLLSEVIRL